MASKAILEAPRRRRLVNAVMDAYLEWRDECAAVSDAYRRWADAGEADLGSTWRAYEAALDREERASAVYDEIVRRIRDLAARESDRETVRINGSASPNASP
jgi:hypothetical protein